nr:MAG TPA: hypothetical protein [Caudoviricetes sp.]
MLNINDLIKQAQEVTMSGLPFMDGKEKLEVAGEVLNNTLTVEDYGYLESDDGEYVVISLKEYPKHFIYGGSVVTEAFKKLESKVGAESMVQLIQHGLTFKLSELVSKNKRKYIRISFFPN